MERKDCSDCGYFSPDFCRGMPGGRIESFEVITALQRNPRVQALIGIHIRLHPDNINRDGGIEIPEAWMPTIKKHNNGRSARKRTAWGANY
ncbi:hypothetical protein pdam_00018998 [Pocillopora damicornis]|uniref:Uncharacterized protein n=1 Tax=Pocillopora damicornis TaxID=46731 RepID=A0A3M6U1M5_POCDA|nr:hypothetical protein pdam_00018998 [Pocillopora damicornis]